MVRSGDKIVLINEVLTGKIFAPGGQIDTGETPQQTAQRETWEETGLVVTVKSPLVRVRDMVYFDCVSDSDIIAFEFNNRYDGNELPVWFAPHYGIEVSSAMLVSLHSIPESEFRFYEHLAQLKNAYLSATDQTVVYVGNLVSEAPRHNQVELGWLIEFQSTLASFESGLKESLNLFLMLGNVLAEPALLVLLFPVVYWRFGKLFTYAVFFNVTVTSLLALVAQQGFALPRPHVYIPSVELANSYGYSFPSVAMAVWFSVAVMLLSEMKRLTDTRYLGGFALLMGWLVLAKFYSGSSFILDMLIGALFGSLTAFHMMRLKTKPDVDLTQLLSSKGVWFGLCLVTALMSFFWMQPVFAKWLAVVMTASAMIISRSNLDAIATARQLVWIVFALLLANSGISLVYASVTTSSVLSLLVETLRYPLLILLFTFSVRRAVNR